MLEVHQGIRYISDMLLGKNLVLAEQLDTLQRRLDGAPKPMILFTPAGVACSISNDVTIINREEERLGYRWERRLLVPVEEPK